MAILGHPVRLETAKALEKVENDLIIAEIIDWLRDISKKTTETDDDDAFKAQLGDALSDDPELLATLKSMTCIQDRNRIRYHGITKQGEEDKRNSIKYTGPKNGLIVTSEKFVDSKSVK